MRNGIVAALVVLALATSATGLGWWKQDLLKEQYQWRTVMGPSVLTSEQKRALTSKQEFSECAHGCPTMVVVPAGTFTMGSPESEKLETTYEGPQHAVTFAKPFAVGKTDVMFAEWDICVSAGACPKVSDNGRGRATVQLSW